MNIVVRPLLMSSAATISKMQSAPSTRDSYTCHASMRKSLRVQSHKYRLKTYKNCFLGNEAVDFLVQFGFAYSRQEAVYLGRRLAKETRLFEHVARKHDFEDRDYYYY